MFFFFFFGTVFEVLFANFPGTPPYEATKTKLQSNPIFHELLVQCNNPNTQKKVQMNPIY